MESGADTFRVKEAPTAQLAAAVRNYLSTAIQNLTAHNGTGLCASHREGMV
ncbi:hypothetical protein SUDANB51_08012 [Streptomyces sp. enrichment culture]